MHGWSLLESEELPARFLAKRNPFSLMEVFLGLFTGGKGYPFREPFFGPFFTGDFEQSERKRAFWPFSHLFCFWSPLRLAF